METSAEIPKSVTTSILRTTLSLQDKMLLSTLESDGWNRCILDVQASAGCRVSEIETRIVGKHLCFVILRYLLSSTVISAALIQFSFFLYARTIASSLLRFLRLVSHGPDYTTGSASLSFQISSQSEEILLAHVFAGFMRGQVTATGGTVPNIRDRCYNISATEVVQLQRAQFSDIPVIEHQKVHAVVDCCPALVILASTEGVCEVLAGHVQGLVALDFLSVSFMLRADRFHQHSIRYRIDQTIS